MVTQINLGDLAVDVTFKDIKNIHLSVHPPAGRISVAAPVRMNLDTIRVFTITKLGWIKRQQRKLRSQARETPREYLGRESHFVWGKRFLLDVRETEREQSVEAKHSRLVLKVRPDATAEKKEAVLADWYREQLKAAVPDLIAKWSPIIGVEVKKFYVQKMKTKWGSCNPRARSIRLNTDLAKKPKECFEYVVVHEMVHLVEPTHNARFIAIMDTIMPTWRTRRDLLNELPISHNEWKS
jgi:predicted metal-dependent hydrolase